MFLSSLWWEFRKYIKVNLHAYNDSICNADQKIRILNSSKNQFFPEIHSDIILVWSITWCSVLFPHNYSKRFCGELYFNHIVVGKFWIWSTCFSKPIYRNIRCVIPIQQISNWVSGTQKRKQVGRNIFWCPPIFNRVIK